MALVLAMLRPMLPVTVRAADGGGTCGAGTAWAFDADTGVLAVPGAGCLAPEKGASRGQLAQALLVFCQG